MYWQQATLRDMRRNLRSVFFAGRVMRGSETSPVAAMNDLSHVGRHIVDPHISTIPMLASCQTPLNICVSCSATVTFPAGCAVRCVLPPYQLLSDSVPCAERHSIAPAWVISAPSHEYKIVHPVQLQFQQIMSFIKQACSVSHSCENRRAFKPSFRQTTDKSRCECNGTE